MVRPLPHGFIIITDYDLRERTNVLGIECKKKR